MSWAEFCDRLASLGEGVDAAADEAGLRHLANQTACWLTYALGADVGHPVLFRSSDPIYSWGGPNADQVARRAPIVGDGVYRLHGSMGSCEEFIVQIKRGGTQSGGATVATEVRASDLGITPGDDFSLVFAAHDPRTAHGPDEHWIPLDADAGFIHIRDYYFRWLAAPPATFVLERLDTQGRPSRRPDAASVLAAAIEEMEHSAAFWHSYQERMLAQVGPNEFLEPHGQARGVAEIVYSHAGVELADGEALVVELDHGGAPMWDVQLYNRPWYEALEFANHTSCTNHALAGDGPIVICAADPGGANWLDTQGLDRVLASIRWWRPTATPAVSAQVVPISSLDLPPVDRRAQIRQRSSHVSWRYRT